jgi:hypothetical protein
VGRLACRRGCLEPVPFQRRRGEDRQFGPDKDSGSVLASVLEAARRYDLPVNEKDVRIRQQDRPAELYIDVSYTVQVEVLPRFFYPWTFSVAAHGWFVPGGRIPLR